MAENKQDQTTFANQDTGEVPIARKPDGPTVTWGTPEMYQNKSPSTATGSDIVRDDSFFDLPPQQNPLSPAYTYTPSVPPTQPNLANDPTMSGSGTVSLPPAIPQPAQPIRDNPFGGPPIPPPPGPPNPSLNPAQPPVTSGQLYNPPAQIPTGPLPTPAFNAGQIGLLEQKKQLAADQAENLARGQSEAARIQSEAAAQDKTRTEGDPVALLKAQQDHADAMKLPDSDPNKRALLQKAEFDIRSNEGARSALLRAQMDAERRDNEIRAMIQKARSEQIDPDRWWNNKSTGGKVLAGIGMILGGMGGGLARTGRNPAIEVMNQAINEDINAQKANIDNQWKSIAEQNNLNNTAFNRELHRQTWENNYRTAALERVKLDLAANAARSESETVKNNAKNGIIDLTNEQMKIRNQQYIVAVQAAAAEASRVRGLEKDANSDIQELMRKDGVSFEDASKSVYSSPRYRELVQMGRAPEAMLRENASLNQLAGEYKAELSKQQNLTKLIGAMPGTKRYEDVLDIVRKDPKYQPLFQDRKIGVVVPAKEPGKESAEQIANRTVFVTTYDSTGKATGTTPRLAVNKKAADDYKEYADAAPDVESAYRALVQAKKDGDRGKYNAARAQLIDSMPKFMLGSGASGPTKAQAEETYGQMIPSYYDIGGGGVEQKLNHVQTVINGRKSTMEATTFGTNPAAPKVSTVTEYDPVTKKPIEKAK